MYYVILRKPYILFYYINPGFNLKLIHPAIVATVIATYIYLGSIISDKWNTSWILATA